MNELVLLDKFEKQMLLEEWEKEDLQIILVILEEIMLAIDVKAQKKYWKILQIYYNCLKGRQKMYNFKQAWFDSFDAIKKELIDNKIVPKEQEMQRLINERKINKTSQLQLDTNHKVDWIIEN